MKHVYLLLVLFTTLSSYGQNWEPFPYDSVYFMNPNEGGDVLVPFVKSADSNDYLVPMSTSEEDEVIRYLLSTYDGNESPNTHWFGDNLRDSLGYLLFNSLYFDETIHVDLTGELHHADTSMFNLNDSVSYYIRSSVDSVYYDMVINDSIKAISLTLLDAQLAEEEIEYDITDFSGFPVSPGQCLNPLLLVSVSTHGKQILIGKNNGIIEMPNLAFYPYCRSFRKHITIDSLESFLSTPILHVGDRYEMVSKNLDLNINIIEQYEYATEVTDMMNLTASSEFVYTVKYWKNRVPYDGYQSFVNPESYYEDDKVITLSYDYDSYIFNGLNENKDDKSYFLRMNSYWGLPLLEPVSGSYLPLNMEEDIEFAHLINLDFMYAKEYAVSGINDEQCLTYYSIDGEEFGSSNNLELEELDVENNMQLTYQNGILKSNLPLSGLINIYSVNGQEISTVMITEPLTEIQLSYINKGVYFIRIKDVNRTIKFVVNE